MLMKNGIEHLKEGGDIICTRHQGYDRKSEAIADIEMVKGLL